MAAALTLIGRKSGGARAGPTESRAAWRVELDRGITNRRWTMTASLTVFFTIGGLRIVGRRWIDNLHNRSFVGRELPLLWLLLLLRLWQQRRQKYAAEDWCASDTETRASTHDPRWLSLRPLRHG
jgi:hypothetical protein